VSQGQPEPVEIQRLGVSEEFRALMAFFAARAPQGQAEIFAQLAIDWTAAERDEAA
jgi:hypothetical protein